MGAMKHRIVVVVAMMLALAACASSREERMNVRPPPPGSPRTGAEVTGIYRSIHQGLLQFRDNGTFNLIVPADPPTTDGVYRLENGRLEVRSENCGNMVGRYDVVVTGEQEAGKATLRISAVDDGCEHRRRYLTIDPWVYANS